MRTLSTEVTQIQTGTGSMDQTQMDALIASIQGTSPVPKPQPVYACNPDQVDSRKIIDYGSAVGAKRYRYATVALSLDEFDHTTGKVLEITTSLTERSNQYGWVYISISITEVTVVPKTYDLFRKYGKFTVEELTAHIKLYVDADNKRA